MRFDGRRRRGKEDEQGGKEGLTASSSVTRDIEDPATSGTIICRILDAAGPRPDSRQLMRAALEQLRDWTGCEAGAIRLEDAGDYPYVVEQGFPAHYLGTDNSLLGYGPDGVPLRDEYGRPLLECACGEILQGSFPRDHVRFTPYGTYWSGDLSEPLPDSARAELRTPLRGRCAAGGYESVACFPLRAHGEVFGILQLNSKQKHTIAPDVLAVLEPVAAVFATMLREQIAREATRDSEVLHKALFESMVEAFAYCRLLKDPEGEPRDWVYLASNDALVKLFGVSNPVGKRQSQLDPAMGEESRELLEVCARVVASGRPERIERHFPGTGKWLSLRVSSPAPNHFLAICEDISERRRAEERLRRNQFTLDSMSDYSTWADPSGRIVEVSESTCRHLEYSRDELLSMTVFDIDPGLTPDRWSDHWRAARETGTRFIQTKHRTKSGRDYPVEIVVDRVVFGDEEYSCGFCRDISDRKKVEEQLLRAQFFLDNINDYPLWTDSEARIVDVSDTTCRRLGYSRDELLGMTIFDIDPDMDRGEWETRWAERRELGPRLFETQHRTSSGELLPVEVLVSRVLFGGREFDCALIRDISERKRAEERSNRMQFTLDAMGDYPMWTDAEARIVDVSESTCRRLGYSRDELLGMTIFDIDPSMTSEEWSNRWETIKRHGSYTVEAQHRTKDGRLFPVEVVVNHVWFGGQEFTCGFCRDVSERKAIEEKLWRTQSSVDSMSDYLTWVDAESRIVEVSESTCRHLGYTRDELLSMTLFDVDPDLTPERWEDHWKRMGEIGSRTVQVRHRAKDGRTFPVELSVDHLSFRGQEYDCTLCRDITERKQAEERLQRTQFIVDSMTDYPMWVDSEGRLAEVSESTCSHLGYARDELLGMTVFDVDPNMSPDLWPVRWREGHESGSYTIETEHRTKSGTVYPVEIVVDHVSFGGQEYSCGFCRDISERKQAEEMLRRTQFSLDNMGDYPIWVDSEGHLFDVSESTCRHLEYTRDELLNMTVFDIDPGMTPDRWSAHWPEMAKLGTEIIETSHRTKTGTEFPVEIAVNHVWFGEQEFTCAFCRDITERRQVEERMRRMQFSLDAATDYPMWVDSEARIVDVSESTCRYLEYSREELLGMTIFDLDRTMTRERWSAHWEKARALGSRTIEVRHRTKSGKLLPVEITVDHVTFGGQEYDCNFCRDISERKRLEESLRLTQLTVDQAPDMVLWMEPEGRLVYVNASACSLLGRQAEEITSLHIWDLDRTFGADGWKERWEAIQQFGPLHFESLLTSADGRDHPVEVSSHYVDFEGKEYGVAFVRDIEERKRSEQVLRESEERYRLLFELEADAILLIDEESGGVIEANSAAVRLFGYSRHELLSMNSADLIGEPEEDRTPASQTAPSPDLRSNRRKDGSVFPAEVRHRHLELEGRTVRVAVVRDVTERVKAEEALRESRQMLQLVLDAVPLRIAWKDCYLRHLGCNRAFALDANLPDTSAIVGLSDDEVAERLERPVPPGARDDDIEVMRSGIAKLQYEEAVTSAFGNPRLFRTSKVPLRNIAGDVIGLLSVHEDVTERTTTLRALRERDEQLRHSQKMEAVGRLAGGIAHDFNNVLTTIIGYSDLILGSPDCSEGPMIEDVKEIKAAAERASGLTKQILAFSRRQALRPQILSLNQVITEIERMLTRTLGADVELRTVLDPELGRVDVDEHQFVQVMLNLAVNARDAMPQGGVLTIETANVELDKTFCQTHPDTQPGSYVSVMVTDTGMGMDADTLARVFEPFYTTKAVGEGTGLGLATVYGVVAQSGGYTYVTSEPGQGTTFTIYFPRVGDSVIRRVSTYSDIAAGGLPTVLVIDDDDTFRALTIRILEKRGYRTIPASDGDQAVEILRNQEVPIDVLLTDIVMPGALQGDQVGQMAHTLRPGLPVLYMSSYTRETIARAGTWHENMEYLEKPFTADSLIQQIRACLGQDRVEQS